MYKSYKYGDEIRVDTFWQSLNDKLNTFFSNDCDKFNEEIFLQTDSIKTNIQLLLFHFRWCSSAMCHYEQLREIGCESS